MAPVFRWIFVAAAVAALFSRFFHRGVLLGYYQDDFFYYLKVAENLALHGVSSFDGTHLTNGYHPLWLITLTLLYRLLPGISFFVGLQLLTLGAAVVFFSGSVRVLAALGVREGRREGMALLVSLQALLLLRFGMEITLALPLGVLLILAFLQDVCDFSALKLVGLGLLASLTVLARLDAIELVMLLGVAHIVSTPVRGLAKRLVLFLVGFSPFFLYLGVNKVIFHTLLPVSGQAKQMKVGLWPSTTGLLSLVQPLDRMKMVFVLPCLALLLAGLVCLPLCMHRIRRTQAAVLGAVLLFPIVQLLILSVVSDWVLWPWYFYPFVFTSLVSMALMAQLSSSSALLPAKALRPLGWALGCAYLAYLGAYSLLGPNSVSVYTSSRQLAEFMDAHPGIYAMGDQAGTTGYLSRQPLIQLEGLAMDVEYLGKIKAREPLRQILDDYHAAFYITFSSKPPGTCFTAREPGQAGSTSPVSTGVVCGKPLASFYRMADRIDVYPAQDVR